MAESIAFDVAGDIITKLGSLALEEVALIWGVNDELQKLKDTFSTIRSVLLDAEEKQSKSHAVKNWLSRLKDAFYEVDDLIDEFSYETLRRQVMTQHRKKTKQVRIFFSKSNQVVFGFKMGHKIKEMREKLGAIAADRTQFQFIERIRDSQDEDQMRERRQTHSFIPEEEVIGREEDKKVIIDHLMDANIKEDISVIAVVGMGGLGKTALTQSIFNNEEISKCFELKLWVCISEEFDVKTIVENIIESATKKKPEPLEMDLLQNMLRGEVDGKKYLLILDDVWNDKNEKWANLKRLLMGGAKGSKIIITARSEQVAKTCDAAVIYSLQHLSEHNSWLLFKKTAFKGGDEVGNENLIKIGKEIVGKLKGVPLAIRIIGRLLCYKESEADWLSFKDNELDSIMQQEDEILSILRLSYNHLPSNLKQCFEYCALFPKDYLIKKDKVIKQWVAQGYVQPNGKNKPIEDVGDDYFMELSWRSFFQDFYKNVWGDIMWCKMHDLMHDLACSMAENEFMCTNVDATTIDKRTRHVSFNLDPYKTMKLSKSLFEAKKLRTFFWQYNPYSDFESDTKPFVRKTLSSFQRLRSLKLCSISLILKFPNHMSKLKHLRYLDLSENKLIKFLPDSITELYNLETLMLQYCFKLRELPRDTKNLIKLRHLNLDGCKSLTRMPKGLGRMTSLLTMSLFVLAKGDGNRLSELNGFKNLRGSLTIRGLTFCTVANLQKDEDYLKLKSGLRNLVLDWNHDEDKSKKIDVLIDNDEERVLECLQPHPNIRKIEIQGYRGVRLCTWLSYNSHVHLVRICLSSCERLQHLPQFDQFQFLKHLFLENLPCIEYIDDNDFLSPSTFFPSLEILRICNMPNLKGWWNWKGETSIELAQESISLPTFPSLSHLLISDCCQLTSIPSHPPLKSLGIGGVSMHMLNMVIKMTLNIAGESPPPLHKLQSLSLERIKDLEFLPEELFCNLTALENLSIDNCHNLQMSFSCVDQEQHFIDEYDDGEIWKKLASLRSLNLRDIPKLEYLPKGLQHLTTVKRIYIEKCLNLMSLPEWIGNLTSLSTLRIEGCQKLTSLPEGIRHLTSLAELKIENCCNLTSLSEGMRHLTSLQSLTIQNCPKLLERCKEGVGEDWSKIVHIPYRKIL